MSIFLFLLFFVSNQPHETYTVTVFYVFSFCPILLSGIMKKNLRKIANFSIFSPADHPYCICHFLSIHTICLHTGMMPVRTGSHDQKITFSVFFHLFCQRFCQPVVDKFCFFIIHIIALCCL